MVEEIIKILDKAVCLDIRVYDMKERTPFYDYSIIASVNSDRQGLAAVSYLKDDATKLGFNIRSASNSDESGWFYVDLDDVIVHIFVGKERLYYNLDGMYSK